MLSALKEVLIADEDCVVWSARSHRLSNLFIPEVTGPLNARRCPVRCPTSRGFEHRTRHGYRVSDEVDKQGTWHRRTDEVHLDRVGRSLFENSGGIGLCGQEVAADVQPEAAAPLLKVPFGHDRWEANPNLRVAVTGLRCGEISKEVCFGW